MAFQGLTGINGDLIQRSCSEAYKTKGHYHIAKAPGNFVIFAFGPSFSKNDWFAAANTSPFGEIKMKRNEFHCMRSIGKDEDATVNEAFLNTFELIKQSTSFVTKVEAEVKKGKQIVFTGHSSGGAVAILATVWYLHKYFITKPDGSPEPHCVTFGAPLVGDFIFKHALGRENWSRFFTNFVTRFDIVPRIMLARKASIQQTFPHVLSQLVGNKYSIQENDQGIADFHQVVLKDTSTVAYQAVSKMSGNGEAFLETLSSFLELSPYRPVGTFVFSTGTTKLVSVNNSEAILQILFYASQSNDEQERSQIPCLSVRDHYSYEELVQGVNHLDVHDLPLKGESLIASALNELGLSGRAGQCVRAALKAENQRVENQNDIFFPNQNQEVLTKLSKIKEKLKWVEETYKPACYYNGYYDSFKANNGDMDFDANVKRAELAGIFDEVLGLVKNYQLPDEFEGNKEWIKLATRYRRLVEPLDIANYYRHLKNEDTGVYMNKGRPSRYIYAERGYKHELLKPQGLVAETVFWRKLDALHLGSRKDMEKELEYSGSKSGTCFWAEVEELKGKPYEKVELRIKTLEGLLEEKEVDDQQIFLESSTVRMWWYSLPDDHKRQSPVKNLIRAVTGTT